MMCMNRWMSASSPPGRSNVKRATGALEAIGTISPTRTPREEAVFENCITADVESVQCPNSPSHWDWAVQLTGPWVSAVSAHDVAGPPECARTGSSPLNWSIRRRSSQMALELAFAVAARVVLALSPLGSYIQDDSQLSSPLTSYSRRKLRPALLSHGTAVNTT